MQKPALIWTLVALKCGSVRMIMIRKLLSQTQKFII
jgi:hypothetical protein